jgi:ammonia channel protein AmtB
MTSSELSAASELVAAFHRAAFADVAAAAGCQHQRPAHTAHPQSPDLRGITLALLYGLLAPTPMAAFSGRWAAWRGSGLDAASICCMPWELATSS